MAQKFRIFLAHFQAFLRFPLTFAEWLPLMMNRTNFDWELIDTQTGMIGTLYVVLMRHLYLFLVKRYVQKLAPPSD